MKILVGYPPVISDKGVPLLSQNRQFQWFSRPTYVYPMVPASAATLMKGLGHETYWIDAIAEEMSPECFEKRFAEISPDIFLTETKTPVVKKTWKTVDRLKSLCPGCKFVLCGDHVTALPEETMKSCCADYILLGGDYDFALKSLVGSLESGTEPPRGIVWRGDGGEIRGAGGGFDVSCNNLAELPNIDRKLTRWDLYSRKNGNFRRTPGTYIMSGRDCWWGKCRFCSWTTLYPSWRVRPVEDVLDEIGKLLDDFNIREIFDDTGTFPAGDWLKRFCSGMISRGYNRRVTMGCNMIPGVLDAGSYRLMADAGFRFVLFGLESASHSTLERICKYPKAAGIAESVRMAHEAGLKPHVTCMVGYPWETYEDACATVELTKSLFDKGWIDTLQGTIVIPYPGTPLFRECSSSGWLRTMDWDRYDMREPVMKTEISDERIFELIRRLYTSFASPSFVMRKILEVRSFSDAAFLWNAGIRVLGHLLDFRKKKGHHRDV